MTRKLVFPVVLVVVATLNSIPAFAQNVEGSFRRTLNVSAPADLSVTTGSGDITIRSGAPDRVEVFATVRVSRDRRSAEEAAELLRRIESNPPVVQNGNVVAIGNITDRDLQRNIAISYDIQVPPASAVRSRTGSGNQDISGVGTAEVNTGSGDVSLDDVGSVRAQTGSGNIDAETIRGTLHGRTGSGSITVAFSTITDADLQTGSGDVRIRNVSGSLRAQTGSGGIDAEGVPSGVWDLQTGSGDVAIRLPATAGFNLQLQTGSGDIQLNHPVTVQGTIDRRRLQGQVRGGGPQVAMRTGSGNIRID